jgi:hypothetical protein
MRLAFVRFGVCTISVCGDEHVDVIPWRLHIFATLGIKKSFLLFNDEDAFYSSALLGNAV